MSVEAEALRSAGDHGVPVARVVAVDDGAVLGSAGMVVERLDGETIARKLLRDDEYATARRVLGAQVGEALARLHAMPSAAVEGLRQPDQPEQFRTVPETLAKPHPAFELGFPWPEAHRPPPTPPARRPWESPP